MCEDCGCGDTALVSVPVQRRILSANERQAAHNREHFLARGVLAVNLMGSPGSGKTALLEATARLAPHVSLAALSGDLATEHDAERLARAGIRSRAITTGTACHLDAEMVHRALHHLAWDDVDRLFIENVGNLVCPAIYDLGQRVNVVALSVTEGEDKPEKYPVMFRAADLVLWTKVDLLDSLPDVRLDRVWDSLARVMPEPRVLALSARTGEGMADWLEWLDVLAGTHRAEAAARS